MTWQSVVGLRRTNPHSLVYSRRMLVETMRPAPIRRGGIDAVGRSRPPVQHRPAAPARLAQGRLLRLFGVFRSPRLGSAAIAKERLLNVLVFDRAVDDARILRAVSQQARRRHFGCERRA